jgi:6,7-dimethyl-8-ribityllumazine synthase
LRSDYDFDPEPDTDHLKKFLMTEKHFYPSPTEGLPELPKGVDQRIGRHDGTGRRIGICSARFNIELTGDLVSTAVDTLIDHQVAAKDIHVSWVPGSFELPLALQQLAEEHRLDALIACGVVIEGDTRHASLIMDAITPQFLQLSSDLEIPVIDAVVSAPSMELARIRCSSGKDSRGAYAALAALECCRT